MLKYVFVDFHECLGAKWYLMIFWFLSADYFLVFQKYVYVSMYSSQQRQLLKYVYLLGQLLDFHETRLQNMFICLGQTDC